MLKECGETHSCMLGVTDVDLVTAVVFPRFAKVETTCSVWRPCLLIPGVTCASTLHPSGAKGFALKSCLPQRYAYADTDGVIHEVWSMLSVCSACWRSLSHKCSGNNLSAPHRIIMKCALKT